MEHSNISVHHSEIFVTKKYEKKIHFSFSMIFQD